MFYLEYENDTKLVAEIHESEPTSVRENHSLATSESFDVGMELEYVITVDTVDQDGKVTASSTTKQTVPAHQLINRMNELKQENSNLKQSQSDQDEAIMNLMLGGM